MKGNSKKFIGILIAVILLLTIVLTKCSQQTPLPAYSGDGEVTPTPIATPAPPAGKFFTDDLSGATVFVPQGFTYLIKSGCSTFIHSASETSIQIQVSDYYPGIQSITEEGIQYQVQNMGGQLISFMWRGASQYSCIYTVNGVVYYESTAFDRDTVVMLVCKTYAQNYDAFNDTLTYVINSFKWTGKTPFPDDYYVCYNDFGNFEYAIPAGWGSEIVDNALFAQDEKTGASMSVNVFQSDASYAGVSQTDYVTYMQQHYPNYILQSFANDNRIIYSTGTYSSATVRYIVVCYMLASGSFEYAITFTCPSENYSANAQTYAGAIDLFRLFY